MNILHAPKPLACPSTLILPFFQNNIGLFFSQYSLVLAPTSMRHTSSKNGPNSVWAKFE